MAPTRPKNATGKTKARPRREKRMIAEQLERMQAQGVRVAPTKEKSKRRKAERERQRANKPAPKKCPGTNLNGEPCKAIPLKKGTRIEDVRVSGEYCLFHDPDIPQDAWKKWRQVAGTQKFVARNHSLRRPLDLLADAVAQSPGILLGPHLEAIGMEWDGDSQQIVPIIRNGKRARGATHVGFSREGVAKKSRHKDMALQMRAVNDLNDRLYGKARMSMDLAGEGTINIPQIPQTMERAREVAEVLAQCGALPSANEPTGDESLDY